MRALARIVCHLRFYHNSLVSIRLLFLLSIKKKGKNDYIVIMTRKASVLTWKNSRSRLPRDNRVYRTVAALLALGMSMWLFFAYMTSLLSLVALSTPSYIAIIDGKPLQCLGYTANPNQQFIIFGDPSGQGVVSRSTRTVPCRQAMHSLMSAHIPNQCPFFNLYREMSCLGYWQCTCSD